MTLLVTLFSTPQCTLCRYVREDLDLLAAEQPLQVRVVDVSSDPELAARYLLRVPVVEIAGGPVLAAPIALSHLRAALAAVELSSP